MKRLFLIAALLMATPMWAQHHTDLKWTPSTDGSTTSQVVCRGTAPGKEDCNSPLTTFADNTTATYSDTTGVVGNVYYYIVEACNTNGCSASNEAAATFGQTGGVQIGP